MEYVITFLVGGGLCLVGQLLIDLTGWTPARIMVGYVVGGVTLTAVGLYQPLVNLAHAGATVPLSGFGYTLATGVKQAVEQQGLYGVLVGGLSAAAAGVTVVITLALLAALAGKSKMK